MTLRLATPRLNLDRLAPHDAAGLYACRSHPAVARFQGWVPRSPAEAAAFIRRDLAGPVAAPDTWTQLAVRKRSSRALVGDLGVHTLTDPTAVEVGVSIHPAHQRRGYAREALGELLTFLARERDVRTVIARTHPLNEASIGLLGSLGFEGHRARHPASDPGEEVTFVKALEDVGG